MATVKAAREDADAPTVFLSLCCVGLVMSAPIAAQHWVPLEGRLLAACIGMALLALMGQMLFTWGMGHTTATSGSAMTQLVPVFAWMLAIGGLGERVQPLAVVGAVLCVGGVLAGLLFRQPASSVRAEQ
jgi:drug/metabolite transporter (DMT)-like permease